METYEEKYKDLVKRLNKAREEKGAYTFNSVLNAVAPELKIDESEDEVIMEILIQIVKGACDKYGIKYQGQEIGEEKLLAWIEKQGKRKPWSEDDLYMLKQAIRCVNNSGKLEVSTEEIEDWLKSLSPQTTWKPSERKIQSVADCALNKNIDADTRLVLDELYQDLLKLREE